MLPIPNAHAIDHSDVPVRLFKSDFLEFFTHISPIVVLFIYVPVIVIFLISAVASGSFQGSWLYFPLGLVIGIFIWTLIEYTGHRFLFHYQPRTPAQERVIFLFHGVHHYQPKCKTRLVMPIAVSIPFAIIFYVIFYAILGLLVGATQWVAPVYAGFMLGYVTYDMTHYATHHFPMRRGFLKYLKRYHMLHHYKTPEERFGVSSPMWDVVFQTFPRT
jgi:sterol desaturase/sphingolipid hydroxylase (fatty acid hydroxylase superfamily)